MPGPSSSTTTATGRAGSPDGLTATRTIRAAEAARGTPRTPIVALTADALAEHVAASRTAGADHHLAKPIKPEALVAILGEVLALSSSGDERLAV